MSMANGVRKAKRTQASTDCSEKDDSWGQVCLSVYRDFSMSMISLIPSLIADTLTSSSGLSGLRPCPP